MNSTCGHSKSRFDAEVPETLARQDRSSRFETLAQYCRMLLVRSYADLPFSQPEAGVQAIGSIKWCEHICPEEWTSTGLAPQILGIAAVGI
jgi:hypothetical protein